MAALANPAVQNGHCALHHQTDDEDLEHLLITASKRMCWPSIFACITMGLSTGTYDSLVILSPMEKAGRGWSPNHASGIHDFFFQQKI